MSRILFCASEVYPFSKTGGLGDLAGALPVALHELGHDVRVVTPGYRNVLQAHAVDAAVVARFELPANREPVTLLQTCLPGSDVPVYIVDARQAFDRDGGPYLGPDNREWPDNSRRFATFARAIVEMAMARTAAGFAPDVVHCNDWQTGLVPALLSMEKNPPGTLFVINNLAYQGLFGYDEFRALSLPASFWSWETMEFNGWFSFIKGGLVYADYLATVSRTYAEEIQTPAFGYGLDGLLRHRSDRLVGVLNGIDEAQWNPAGDPYLERRYDVDRLSLKADNKIALQEELGLEQRSDAVLIAHVGRLARQKGVELLLGALPAIMKETDVQLAVLGSGDPALADALEAAARAWPGRMFVNTGFSEPLAHRIEAASDIFVMPSLYEPCGLNQMYSMRYGSIPVVRRTGGLKDTVACSGETTQATGFCFDEPSADALTRTLRQALDLYRREPDSWRGMMLRGMKGDYSWARSAREYTRLYGRISELHAID